MQFDSAELTEFAVAKNWQQVTLEVLLVLRTSGVLQVWPNQLTALVVHSLHGVVVAFEELRFIVSGVDPFHQLVSQALRLALAWHLAFCPRLGPSPASITVGVVPVEKFPLGPKVLNLGPLITLTHHGPPSVVLQPRSPCSIEGHHWATPDPPRNCLITA